MMRQEPTVWETGAGSLVAYNVADYVHSRPSLPPVTCRRVLQEADGELIADSEVNRLTVAGFVKFQHQPPATGAG